MSAVKWAIVVVCVTGGKCALMRDQSASHKYKKNSQSRSINIIKVEFKDVYIIDLERCI